MIIIIIMLSESAECVNSKYSNLCEICAYIVVSIVMYTLARYDEGEYVTCHADGTE